MPLVIGKKCLTLTHFISSPKRTMSITSYWEPAAALDHAALVTAAADAQILIGGLLQPLMCDQMLLPGTKAQYDDDTSQLDTYDGTNPLFGSAAIVVAEDPGSRTLPDQDALLIQKRTGLHGRNARGRFFVPGIWEDFNDDGVLATAGEVPAKALAAALGADQTFGGIVCHARHYSQNPIDLMVITECRVMRAFASRRDRMPHGPHLPA